MDQPSGEKNKSFSEEDVRQLAGYGRPPESLLQAPSYWLRVHNRQKAIKELITQVNERLRKTEAERDGAEAQLGQAAVDFGLISEDAAGLTDKVAEAEKSIDAVKGRTSAEDEQYKAKITDLDEQEEQAKAAMGPMAETALKADEEFEAAQASYRQTDGRIKRLEIELRNALELPESPDRAAKEEELTGRRKQLESDLARQRAELRRASAEQTRIQNEIGPQQLALKKVQAEREALVREHESKAGDYKEKTQRATTWRRSRLAIIGRQVFEQEPRPRLLDGERLFGRIAQSREKVDEVQKDLEFHLAALDAFDGEAVGKARLACMIGAGVVGVLLFAVLLYSC